MSYSIRVAALAAALVLALTAGADAHQGNPNFRSDVRAVAPAVPGLDAHVVNYDDSIELVNRTGETIVVEGYRGEPYLRIGADGAVAVNARSPTRYLNDDRYAEGVKVPASANPRAAPVWEAVDRTGRYTWHDHRIHWMARTVPPQVKDEGKRTKVFDWRVPIEVGGEPAAIGGTLTWVGADGEGFPVAAAIAFAGLALAGVGLVVLVRRRRGGAPAGTPKAEAW